MYENLPFWHAFFTALDFEIVLSPDSNRKIYIKGQYTIPSDTVCYPAKLMHGHIEALLDAGVDPMDAIRCCTWNPARETGFFIPACPTILMRGWGITITTARLWPTTPSFCRPTSSACGTNGF